VKHGLAAIALSLTLTLALSGSARGDSDGDFCIFKGYVAYELREGITAGVRGHMLKVVRVEPNRGIYAAGEAKLLDFEVYHLICSQDRIEISGWRNVFTKYVVDILPSGELKASPPIEYPNIGWRQAARDGPEPLSLSLFGPNDPLLVESLDSEHKYQIVRSLAKEQSRDAINWHLKSELIQLDKNDNVLQRLVLYERLDPEEGD
jgi:hypothetical protein